MEEVAPLDESKLPLSGMTLSRVDTPMQQSHPPGSLHQGKQGNDMRLREEETVLGREVTFEDLLACGLTVDELNELEASREPLLR